jgi:hypothetical protein
MPKESRSGKLLLFVLLLGGISTAVALRQRSQSEINPLSVTANVRSGSGGIPIVSPKDLNHPANESESVWKGLVDASDHRRNRKPMPIPRRPATEIVEEVSSVKFVDTPLRDAFQFLKEQHGVTIWLDEPVLGHSQALLEKQINLSADDVPVSWVLDRILQPLNLDWIAENELIRVTSPAEAAKHVEVRAYDVLDLIAAGFDEETLTGLVENCIHPDSWTPSPDVETGLPRKVPDKIVPRNKEAVPDEPAILAGPGRLRVANGVLIVWQTQRIHAQVVHFLDDLETILDEADEDRRFDPQIITVRHRRSAEVGKRLRLSR